MFIKIMPTSFYEKLSMFDLAVIDLCDLSCQGLSGMIISRINVPKKFRKKGIATKLMKECISEADRTNTTLWIKVSQEDSSEQRRLIVWYERSGFKKFNDQLYRRLPE